MLLLTLRFYSYSTCLIRLYVHHPALFTDVRGGERGILSQEAYLLHTYIEPWSDVIPCNREWPFAITTANTFTSQKTNYTFLVLLSMHLEICAFFFVDRRVVLRCMQKADRLSLTCTVTICITVAQGSYQEPGTHAQPPAACRVWASPQPNEFCRPFLTNNNN